MASRSQSSLSANFWLPLALLLGCLAFRLWKNENDMGELANFAPVLAFAFTGVLFLPRVMALWAPVVLQLGGDLLAVGPRLWLEWLPQSLPAYFCLLLCGFWAWDLRQKSGLTRAGVMGRTVAASLGFYLVTNGFCWLGNPLYAQNPAGLLQCLVTGREGFPPTWWFGLKSLGSDLLFSALIMQVCAHSPKTGPEFDPAARLAS